MANPYYNASGTPATGSAGASAPMRGEFALIAAGFALLPQLSGANGAAVVVNGSGTALTTTVGQLALAGNLSTTGAFNTVLAQQASITLTLPATSQTLATLAGTEALTNKTVNGLTITNSTAGTLTIANGKTLTASNSITLAGTDGTTMTFPTTSATIARTDTGQTFAGVNNFTSIGTTTLNGLSITSSTGTLTIANSKTFAVSNSLTLAGTDGTTMTFPGTSDTVVTLAAAQTLTNKNFNFGSDANGDIIVRVSGAYTRLAVGSNGQALVVAGGAVAWGQAGEAISSQASGNFSVGTSNPNTMYVVSTSAAVASLPATSSVYVGFRAGIKNQSDGLSVTVSPNGTDTIDGLNTAFRVPGRVAVWLVVDSSGSWTVEQRPHHDVGDVKEWTTDTLPAGGWAWVNGQTLNRTTFGGLFAVWGTLYGSGNGSTTFGVRDDRGRVKAGNDAMGGASAANRITSGGSGIAGGTTGAAGGAETHALIIAEEAAHTHGSGSLVFSATNNLDSFQAGSNGIGGFASNEIYNHVGLTAGTDGPINAVFTPTGNVSGNTGSNGSGAAHQNTQPTIITNFIVKT